MKQELEALTESVRDSIARQLCQDLKLDENDLMEILENRVRRQLEDELERKSEEMIMENVRADVKNEIYEQVYQDIYAEVYDFWLDFYRNDENFMHEITENIKNEIRPEIGDDIRQELIENIDREIRNELAQDPKMISDVRKFLEITLEKQVKEDMVKKLEPQVYQFALEHVIENIKKDEIVMGEIKEGIKVEIYKDIKRSFIR